MRHTDASVQTPPKYARLAVGLWIAAGLCCLNVPGAHAEPAVRTKPAATAERAATADAQSTQLRALMEKSGINVALDAIPENTKRSIDEALKKTPKRPDVEQLRRLYVVIDTAYAPEKTKAMFFQRLSEKIPPELGAKILVFLDSPLGRRIVEQEKRWQDPKVFAQIQANAAKLIAELGSNTTRLALYQSLDQALELTQNAVKNFISTAMAVNAALLSGQFEMQNRPTLAEIQKNLESQQFAIASAMSQTMLSSMAYAYRNLSEAELNAYLQFALSPEGKDFTRESSAILSQIMMKCAYDAGKLAQPEQPPI